MNHTHIWVDFRGIQDAFMRSKGIDYFENTRRATYVQRQYAIDNPFKFAHYGEHCWEMIASDGPGPGTINVAGIERQFFDYVGRGVWRQRARRWLSITGRIRRKPQKSSPKSNPPVVRPSRFTRT